MGLKHRGRLLGVRPHGPARALRRRGVRRSAQRAARELPAHRQAHRRRAAVGRGRASIPGYGFLAENAGFARACRDAGLTFIGPSPEAIDLMGSKTAARAGGHRGRRARRARHRGPARRRTCPTPRWRRSPIEVGYPVLIKAVAGGGGKGMRTVVAGRRISPGALRAARSEALSSFGDPRVYLERRIMRPRHIEIQLLGDHHGTVRAVCRARVLDPAPPPEGGRGIAVAGRHARAAARAWPAPRPPSRRRVGYTNAGTIEFLLDESGEFFFLEMNTRLQVEHPITELVTGIDLVHWQIRIARGERLTLDPERAAHAGRPRHRVPHLRRGSRTATSCRRRAWSLRCARRRGRASGATTAGRWRASWCRSSTTR